MIRFKELERCLETICNEFDLGFDIHPEVAGIFSDGTVLYRANLGTKKHPFWIYGQKDSVTKRIKEFYKQILEQLNDNSKSSKNPQ